VHHPSKKKSGALRGGSRGRAEKSSAYVRAEEERGDDLFQNVR